MEYDKMKTEDMREELRKIGAPSSGDKKQLIKRLQDYERDKKKNDVTQDLAQDTTQLSNDIDYSKMSDIELRIALQSRKLPSSGKREMLLQRLIGTTHNESRRMTPPKNGIILDNNKNQRGNTRTEKYSKTAPNSETLPEKIIISSIDKTALKSAILRMPEITEFRFAPLELPEAKSIIETNASKRKIDYNSWTLEELKFEAKARSLKQSGQKPQFVKLLEKDDLEKTKKSRSTTSKKRSKNKSETSDDSGSGSESESEAGSGSDSESDSGSESDSSRSDSSDESNKKKYVAKNKAKNLKSNNVTKKVEAKIKEVEVKKSECVTKTKPRTRVKTTLGTAVETIVKKSDDENNEENPVIKNTEIDVNTKTGTESDIQTSENKSNVVKRTMIRGKARTAKST